MNINYCKAHGA